MPHPNLFVNFRKAKSQMNLQFSNATIFEASTVKGTGLVPYVPQQQFVDKVVEWMQVGQTPEMIAAFKKEFDI